MLTKDMFIDLRERNIDVREKHQLVASRRHSTGDRSYNLVMCLNEKSNPQPFGIWEKQSHPARDILLFFRTKMLHKQSPLCIQNLFLAPV